ncbi:MAG: hypothetical protein D6717_11440, partial [Gammaproteobacteria bacterium]
LTGASSAAITRAAPYSVTATIIDDEADQATDNVVTVSASDPTGAEPGVDDGQWTLTLSRVNHTPSPILVNYALGGTASAPGDYAALTGTTWIDVGQSTTTVTLDVLDDVLLEGLETAELTLVSTSHAAVTVSALPATVTIADDESAAGAVTAWIQAIDLSAYEATDTASIAVILSATNETGAPVTVSFVTGGRAINGTDYTSIGSSVQIASGAISTVVTITPTDDIFFEDTEDVIITLTGSSSAAITRAAPYSVTATITDDEADQAYDNTVTVVAVDASAFENPADPALIAFWLSNTNYTSAPIAITYSVGGTATPGLDYTALSGVTSIAVGAISTTVVISPLDDVLFELAETVELTATTVGHAAVSLTGPTTVTAIIDDAETLSVAVAATDATAGENPQDLAWLQFVLSTTNGTGSAITVTYSTTGRAGNGTDYTALPGTVQIPNGATRAVVAIAPIDDALFEDGEDVIITITGTDEPGLTIAAAPANTTTVTIVDDESDAAGDQTVTAVVLDGVLVEGAGNDGLVAFWLSATNYTASAIDIT